MTAKAKGKVTRAKIWKHRSGHTSAEVNVRGFPIEVHRGERQDLNRTPWVLQSLHINTDFEIDASFELADARRIRDQWIAAVAAAEGSKPCDAPCFFCDPKEPKTP